jgi:hypothetical protein
MLKDAENAEYSEKVGPVGFIPYWVQSTSLDASFLDDYYHSKLR